MPEQKLPFAYGSLDDFQGGPAAGQPAVGRAVVVPDPHREEFLEFVQGHDQAQITAHIAEPAQDVIAARTGRSRQPMNQSAGNRPEEALDEGTIVGFIGGTRIDGAA